MGLLWWACEAPEREPDPLVRWHYEGCRGCALAAEAVLRNFDWWPPAPTDDTARRVLGRVAGQEA